MKKLITICAVAAIVLSVSSMVQAKVVTIEFRPNDLIDLYPTVVGDEDVTGENKSTQLNARRLDQDWRNVAYETYYNPAAPSPQPEGYNTYMNWQDGLTGDNEGIAMFNNWFLGWDSVQTWGETWVAKTDATISATSSNGWQWREISEPYREEEGSCIQFWTTDPAKYIRNGGADLGIFSITVDLYEDTNGNGMWDAGDADVDLGDEIRMWFGNVNGDDSPYYRDDTQAIYFDDQGWGTRTSTVSPFSSVDAAGADAATTGFQAMMNVTAATAVPEPTTLTLLVLGGLGVLVMARRRRKTA